MDPVHLALLVGMGLAAGFVAGLIGLGGGVIFAPVLLFYFQSSGVDAVTVSKLTAGSSLLCTLIASLMSAWFRYRKGAVRLRVFWRVGLFSAAAVLLTTRFITTQPWYDERVFQVVFSIVLVGVVFRMLRGQDEVAPVAGASSGRKPRRRRWPFLSGMGLGAGAVASAAGVGGGIVLVPSYNRLLRLPMEEAAGTSSATIVIIALAGVVSYAVTGWGAAVPNGFINVGYVDVGHAVLLAGPAVLTARAGVAAAHYVNAKALRWSFAVVALAVAGRMLYGALLA